MASADFKVTTPYEFLNTALANKFKNRVKDVIDLAITIPEIANRTAEEIFIGSCIYVCDGHPDLFLGDSMQLKFANAMMGGDQVKTLIKETIQELSN